MIPNENEKLMYAIGDAVIAHQKKRRSSESDGASIEEVLQALNALAAFGGATIHAVPVPEARKKLLERFIRDAAAHAGFSVKAKLKWMQ